MYSVILDLAVYFLVIRVIFVWLWNENAPTKQKQETNGNRAIWLVYQMDTNARGLWLVNRTLGWKDFMPKKFLEINRYFAMTSYCNSIGQWNSAFSILEFFGGELKRLCFDLFIYSPIKQKKEKMNAYQNHFSRSFENRSISLFAICKTKTKVSWFREI